MKNVMYVGIVEEFGLRVNVLFAVDANNMNEDEARELVEDEANIDAKRLSGRIQRSSIGRRNRYDLWVGKRNVARYELKITEKI